MRPVTVNNPEAKPELPNVNEELPRRPTIAVRRQSTAPPSVLRAIGRQRAALPQSKWDLIAGTSLPITQDIPAFSIACVD